MSVSPLGDVPDCAGRRMVRRGLLAFLVAAVPLIVALSRSQAASASDPIRIFVTHSDSWSISGNAAEIVGIGRGSLRGGAKPQTAEVMKTISKRRECHGIVVTINRERADYLLMLERVGGRGVIRKDNKMALFNKDGDMIASSSTRSLGNAVKDACRAIEGR